MAAFVLDYRVKPYRYPIEIDDGRRAMRLIRSHAAEYGIDPNRLGVWGSSAGGHLASSLGTHCQGPSLKVANTALEVTPGSASNQDVRPSAPTAQGAPAVPDIIDQISCKPNFMVLAYPVIGMEKPVAHSRSRNNLFGPDPDPVLLRQYSNQYAVTPSTPPTFIFATSYDPIVPVENSLEFYSALVAAHVPVEMHLFDYASHGCGLCGSIIPLRVWPGLLRTWLIDRSLLPPERAAIACTRAKLAPVAQAAHRPRRVLGAIAMTPTSWTVPAEAAGKRLDAWLAAQLENVSRVRVQHLLAQSKVLVNGTPAKPSLKLRGGGTVEVTGEAAPPPLRAIPEAIPLDIIYEDADLSVINKPAGMMVHAGSGATDDARNRGTLVNALLSHYAHLSHSADPLRPGIVHRLDKQTSGLIVVARNDAAHSRLGEMFSRRQIRKTYIALVHGALKQEHGTINAPISRDVIRRTRMTTKRESGARSRCRTTQCWNVSNRASENSRSFPFALKPGAPIRFVCISPPSAIPSSETRSTARRQRFPQSPCAEIRSRAGTIALDRNFLHAAELEFAHPTTGKQLNLKAPLPEELKSFREKLKP